MSFTPRSISPPRAAEYDPFAAVYNRWMAEDFCRRALPVIDQLVLRDLPPAARILDLCCGTGQMARALLDRGFCVTGLDASEEMLRFARQNAPGAEFIRGDARSFLFSEHFHAVVSTFNSLAHAEHVDDLVAIFRSVRAALQDGSPFLFDLSMQDAYESRWRGSFGLVAEDYACIIHPAFDHERNMGINRITVFQRKTSPNMPLLYNRSDFTILQRCHSQADVRAALAEGGFSKVETFDAQSDLAMTGEAGRMFFLCR